MDVRLQLVVGLILGYQICKISTNNDPFSGINYARNKNATQEPVTLIGYIAALAVDGNTDGDVNHKSCSHTWGSGDAPSSWTVDLGLPLYLTRIIIYNRNDDKRLWDRLKNFKIFGLNSFEGKEVLYDDYGKNLYNQAVISIEVTATKTFTSIQIWIPARRTDATILTLCEVEVYGVSGCEPPTLVSHVRMSSSMEKYLFGISINLTCIAGYTSSENGEITCSENSTWNGVQPTCSPVHCHPPEILENGHYLVSNKNECASSDLNNLYYLCEIKAHCNEGYYLQNPSTITCQENGQWSTTYPKCNIVTCKFSGELVHGKYVNYISRYNNSSPETMPYGTNITIQCETGYKIHGHTERMCTSNGTWSGDDPNCSIVQCSVQNLVTVEHGHYILNVQNELNTLFVNYTETAYLVCKKGFIAESKSNFTCTEDGSWSGPEASCKIVTCTSPSETPYIKFRTWYNGSFRELRTELPFGAYIEADCQQGILKSGSRIRNCTEDGSWNGDEAVCVSLCIAPEQTNVVFQDDNNALLGVYEEGQNLSFTCNEGYTSTIGQVNITCQKDHLWSYLHVCSRIESSSGEASALTATIGGAVGGSVVIIAAVVLVIVIYRKRKDGITDALKRSVRFRSSNTSEYAEVLVPGTNRGKDQVKPTSKSNESEINVVESSTVEYYNINEGYTNGAHSSGNAENRIPEGAIRVENLSDIVLSCDTALIRFTEEFKMFPEGLTEKYSEAVKVKNKGRNRYKNMYAYDETRVVLEKETSDESDYINASYINGYKEPREYIAAQAPTTDMIADFWKMIWQTMSSKIVMLTKLLEEDKIKSVKYWPDSGSVEYGKITVSFEDSDIYTDFTMTTLKLRKVGYPERVVIHFHYTAWPDRGVPKHASSLVLFRNKVVNTPSIGKGPMIVHCSAGVGRTGTFIALDFLTKQAHETGYVDVVGTIKALRKQRVKLVQTLEQYIFVHHALVKTLMLSTSALPTSKFPETYRDLLDVDRKTGKRKLDQEFEMLKKLSTAPDESQYVSAKQVRNRNKNRYSNILPVEKFMPPVSTEHSRDDDYINAVFLPSYKKTKGFIITQTPLETTKEVFWKLVLENNVHTIVMMNYVKEMQRSEVYWPENGEHITFGFITVSNDGVQEIDLHKLVSMTVKTSSEKRCIKQIQFGGWMMGKSLPKSPAPVLSLLELVQAWQQQTGNQPIVVHCMNGAEKSGLFCVVSAVIERMKIEQDVATAHIIGEMARAREQIIPNAEQYQFVHEVVLAYIQQNDTYSNFSLKHGDKAVCR